VGGAVLRDGAVPRRPSLAPIVPASAIQQRSYCSHTRGQDAVHELKQATVEAFAEPMVEVLNYGTLALMVSIGHRTSV
jgi:hypothetical protein